MKCVNCGTKDVEKPFDFCDDCRKEIMESPGGMSIEESIQEEERCKRLIRTLDPNHPILKKFFPSTYLAVHAYWKILDELDRKRREKMEDDRLC